MTTINVNRKNNTIELTKTFEKKASKYGTEEYNDLQAVRRDYPTYKVVVRSSSKKARKNAMKGLDYDFMRGFIERHDNSEKNMGAFKRMIGESEDSVTTLTYGEVKRWFLDQYKDELEVA